MTRRERNKRKAAGIRFAHEQNLMPYSEIAQRLAVDESSTRPVTAARIQQICRRAVGKLRKRLADDPFIVELMASDVD